METAKDLNFGSDEMQVVLTALHDVGRRIKEVGETHKPLFGGEHFLTGKEVWKSHTNLTHPGKVF